MRALWITSLGALLTSCTASGYPPRVQAPPAPKEPPLPVDDLQQALAGRVDEAAGTVDYAALRKDRDALDRHIAVIAAHGPDSTPHLFPSEDHAKAYHLNAYNELTLYGVLNEDPDLESVLDVGFLHAFFRRRKFTLDGAKLTLHRLENDIIRPRYKDARIHFAINCASASCPALAATPFVAEGLDERLDAATRRFLARDDAVGIDAQARTVTLSKLFHWYRKDFAGWPISPGGTAPGSAVAYVRHYSSDERKAQLDAVCGPDGKSCKIKHFDYDWSLNAKR